MTRRSGLLAALSTLVLAALTAVAIASAPDGRFAPAGGGAGQLGPHATALTALADGRIVAGNPHDDDVEVFANDGTPLTTHHVPGLRALGTDGTRLLVADADGVRAVGDAADVLSATGVIALAARPGALYTVRADGLYLHDDRIADVAGATGVALEADGDVLVSTGSMVHRFSAGGEHEDQWPAADARGIAVAPNGSVLVAQGTSHRVGVYRTDGELLGTHTGMNGVSAVAADCRGNVFALDNSDPRGHIFRSGAGSPPCLTPAPTPQPTVVVAPEPPAEATPELGRTQRVTVQDGTVYAGKGDKRRRLSGRTIVPVGTSFDTSDGQVKLEFETKPGDDRDTYGRYMEGEFSDGEFTTHQGKGDSLVEIHLEGSGVGAGTSKAQASAKRRRRVWSTAKGRFRTEGRHGTATVRGTKWFTEDRSNGTYFKVEEGTVAVKSFRTGTTILLGPGEDYLAPAPCVSKRRFWIRLRIPAGTTVRDVDVRIGGRKAPLRFGRRVRALVDLRGMPAGKVAVRIKVRLGDGRMLAGTRVYKTCADKEPRDGEPPPL